MANEIVTWEMAKPIVAQKSKQFEAAMTPDVANGRYRPVGFAPWMAAVAADFQKQPKLCEAAVGAPETVWECLSVAANCGLVPGSAHGQFYLIPRWNGRNRRVECTYIVGYKGLAELAMRHPRVHKVEAFLVYEGEPFDFDPGAGKLTHKYRLDVDRSDEKIVAAFSRVVLTVGNGGALPDPEPLFWVMSRDELLKARDRSDGYKAFTEGKTKSTPWDTDFAAMCRKTVMRRHFTGGSVPRSADLIMAVDMEQRHEAEMLGSQAVTAAEQASGGLRSALGMGTKAIADEPEHVEIRRADPEGDPIDADFEREAARVVDRTKATE